MNDLLTLLALAPLLGPLAGPSQESVAGGRGEARAWEHETSDLPADPRVRFGALANGLRWAVANNAEPGGRAYLRLHVDVGSLAEQDDERGMAHFLEHMAFNGSRHFPAGALTAWFQGRGMEFGADTNAYTSFGETVYALDLPSASEAAVQEGLLVLFDFAGGLSLEDREIRREQGVIDAEQRERDSAVFRLSERQMRIAFAGTLYPERMPIGTAATRASFDAESLRAFYAKWYRPELMTVIAVGDFGAADPAAWIAERFDELRPSPAPPGSAGLPPREPPLGAPPVPVPSFALCEPELATAQLTVQRTRPWVDRPYDRATLTGDLPLAYARRMLNLRLGELAARDGAPFLSAEVESARALRVLDGEGLRIVSAPERWREALQAGERELRRAVQYGFRAAELEELRANALRSLDDAVVREGTQQSLGLLGEILLAAEERFVPLDAATARAVLKPAITAMTVEQCSAAFRAAWTSGELSLSAVGGLDLGPDAAESLHAAYAESAALAVEPDAEPETAAFAYASERLAETGPDSLQELVAERRRVEDLDVHLVRFANGVALNVKRTEFEAGRVHVHAELGEGELSLPPERTALAQVTDQVFARGGLAAHGVDDLRRLTAGREVGFSFHVAESSFSADAVTGSLDLLLQLELLNAYLTAPGWREEGLAQFRQRLPLVFEQYEHDPNGPLLQEFLPRLHGGDPRFGFPPRAELEAVQLEDVRAWLLPQLSSAPLEVTLVGDLDVEAAVAAAARTLGRLPARRALLAFDEHRVVPPTELGLRLVREIETDVPRSLVFLAFPTTDGIEPVLRARLSGLGRLLAERLRLEVREELGAAYAPSARAESSRVYPGSGLMLIQAVADPKRAEAVVDACLAAAERLAVEGLEDAEVARMREPLLRELRDARRRDGFWVQALAEAQRRPGSLDEVRSLEQVYASLAADDLNPLARKYLRRARASILVVNPR